MAEEPTVGVTVDASADPDALARLEAAIAGYAAAGIKTAFKTFDDPGLRKRIDASIGPAFRAIRSEGTAAAKAVQGVSHDVSALVRDLNTASQEGVRFTSSMKQIGSAASEVVSATARARTNERAIEISRREELSREAQLRLQIVKGENSRINIATQAAAQSQLISTRTAGKQRVLVTQEFLRTIGRLERGLGVTLTGLARTTTSAISKAFSGLGSLLRRSNNDFTDGLRPALRRREELMSTSFSKQERVVRESITRQERQLTELRTLSSRGVLGAVSGRGAGIGIGGLAGGVGLGALLTSGFSRFSDLERINKQFLALTGSIEDTNSLLAQVKQFAKETPFDLVGVADLAKGFLAIKTPVDQVLPRVQAVADAVALTGGGVDELNHIQRALGQIVSTGKLQGDELNQLAENLPGLNIRQILADQLTGGNVQTLVALQEAGELSADAVVNGLITGLASDPRLAGASGDLAKTLGGRVANLKESFADFGASLIGIIAGPLKVAVSGLQTGLQTLSDFVKGESLGPTLRILRDGLIGAAAGLAAIVAAKAGVEILQSLGAVVKLAVTPMGLLVVAAVGIGAAFSILSKRSPEVRKVFSDLADRLRDVYDSAKGKLLPFLERIADVVTNTVIPAIGRFANYLLDHAVGAFRRTVGFLRDEVLPVLKVIASFVTDKLTTAFVFVTSTAVRFFNSVKPLIQPAIDGFIVLGKAVRGALSGDFSGLRLGATSAVSGLGAAISNIVGKIGELLTPIAAKIATFFVELFSGPNIKKYISGVLNFVEGIGRVLGTIVSSPIFLKAVAALAAAAVVVGFRFIKGVGEGIASNLPEILSGLGSLLIAGLKKIFTSPLLLTGIIAFASLGPALFKVFRAFGTGAGTEFSKGLAGSVKAGIAGAGGFLQGLRGSSGAAASASTVRAGLAQQQDLQNQFRILGRPTAVPLTTSGLSEATGEVKELRGAITDAQYAGMKLRDSMSNAASAALALGGAGRSVTTGLGQILKGFSGIGDAVRFQLSVGKGANDDPSSGFLNAAKRSFTTLRSEASTAFGGVVQGWKIVGKTVVPGLETIALKGAYAFDGLKRNASTAFGGVVQGWKIAAKGLSSGIETAALKGMYGWDRIVGSRFSQSALAGVRSIAAGFSAGRKTISNAFSQLFDNLKEVAAAQGLTTGQAFRRGLTGAAAGGLAAIGGFTAGKAAGESGQGAAFPALTAGLTGLALSGGNPLVGAVAAGMSLVGSAFGAAGREAKLMKERVKELTSALKTDIQEAVDAGTLSLAKLNAGALGVGDIAGLAGVKDEFQKALGPDSLDTLDSFGLKWQQDIVPILKSGGDADQLKARLRGAFLDAASASGQFTDRFGKDASKVQSLLADLLQPGNGSSFNDLLSSAAVIDPANGQTVLNQDFLDLLKSQKGFLGEAIQAADGLNTSVVNTADSLNELNVAGRFFASELSRQGPRTLYGPAVVDAKEFIDLAPIIAARHAAALDKVSADIDRYTGRLDIAKAAQDNLFNIPGDTDLRAVIDNALIGVQGIGGRIAELIASGEDPTGANVRNALRGIGDDIESVIKQGVSDGVVVDENTARFVTQAVFDAAVAGLPVTSQAYKDAADAYAAALSGVEPTVDKIRAEGAAVQLHKEIQDYLSNHPVSIDVAATIVSLRDDALGRLKINSGGGALPGTTPTAGPYVPPAPPTSTDRGLRGESVQITQVFNERVDTRAAAADIAWRLGVS